MQCEQGPSEREFLAEFNRKAAALRVPLSGSLELTRRCSMSCVHCYLGPQSSVRKTKHLETGTERLLSVLEEITRAGCLYLLITGGDPLLREDFGAVYGKAKESGLLVTVFTNGTLVTEETARLFRSLPPQAVEISLYGATAETHERITGVEGSFVKCMEGIRRLLNSGVTVKLKTVLMTLNIHEFYMMEGIARAFGVGFRFDPAIFPCLNGDKSPIGLRVRPEEAVEAEVSDPARLAGWRKYYEKHRDFPSEDDLLYTCGAGLTNFHIDPYGYLKPCIMSEGLRYDLGSGSFEEGWRIFMPEIRRKKAGESYKCPKCRMKTLCGFCPAVFELECGSGDVPSEYICEIGRRRFEAVTSENVLK